MPQQIIPCSIKIEQFWSGIPDSEEEVLVTGASARVAIELVEISLESNIAPMDTLPRNPPQGVKKSSNGALSQIGDIYFSEIHLHDLRKVEVSA